MPIVLVIVIIIFIKVMAALNEPAKPSNPSRRYDHGYVNDDPETFVVVDVETTGLDSFKDKIIEIGAIKVHKGQDTQETYQVLVKIDKKIPQKATEINGITDEMLQKDGIPIEDALKGFKDFIGNLPTVAYNADFDKDFINNAAERIGMKNIIKRPTCALKLARRAYPGLKSYKQAEIVRIAGFDIQGLHRSLADCKATALIYVNAVQRVKDRVRGL